MNCLIVSAAKIENYETIKKLIPDNCFVIVCDGGLNHVEKLGITPNLIVGDFDSHEKPETSIETIELPCEKDDTDTFFAVKEAFKRGYRNFTLVGLIGQRFDHSLCNLSILMWLFEQNCKAVMIDDFSEMTIIGPETLKSPATITDSYSYFSLMLPSGDIEGLTIKDAKYNLDNTDMKAAYQFGISNEVPSGKISKVSLRKGKILLVKVW